MRAVAATERTLVAIRKADGLPMVIPDGRTKGAYPVGAAAAGGNLSIAKTTSRTATGAYAVNIYSRWETDFTVVATYCTATGAAMRTPGLDDTLAADRLPTGSILLVTTANIGGTVYYVPSYPVGLL